MPFVKIHGTILDSSVWDLSSDTRIVWFTLLAMADENGIVGASVGGLARRAVVTREQCQEALAVFLGPDGDSRDGTTGERIEKVPGGWLVLNHAEYRDRQTTAQAKTAVRVARHRAKVKADREGVTGNDVTDYPRTSPPEAEAEAEADPEGDPDPEPEPEAPTTPANLVSYEPGPLLAAGTEEGQALIYPSSGVLAEIDHVRREVEAESLGKSVGAFTRDPEKTLGINPAIQDVGLPRLLEVVRFRCQQVARGELSGKLWRSMFVGSGFYAALEGLEQLEADVKRARELFQPPPPEGSPEDQARGLQLLESHKLGGK